MNTTENNKLIVDFLGIEYSNNNETFCIPSFGFMNVKGDFQTDFTIGQLKFHKDWNWLMEVVEKIESLDYNFNITSGDATVLINHGVIYQTNIYRIDGTNKIQAVYNTCVEFIKWYNEQKA